MKSKSLTRLTDYRTYLTEYALNHEKARINPLSPYFSEKSPTQFGLDGNVEILLAKRIREEILKTKDWPFKDL